ncbi:hypothetical protein [Roseibium sp.]|uniref:hypothetical protein n=1 Tax=Roseibium sp. TaxID=1936156 RepID=UPI003A97647B
MAFVSQRQWGLCQALALLLVVSWATVASRTEAVAQESCSNVAQTTWLEDLTARASTFGDCTAPAITLTVFDQETSVVWSSVHMAADLFGFDMATDSTGMQSALEGWLSDMTRSGVSGDLPAWPEGLSAPDSGEFPFYVEDGVSQALYSEIRAENRPMVCYVQGMESQRCLLRHPTTKEFQVIGVQSFPG